MLNHPKQAYQDAWCRVQNRLRTEVGDDAVRIWLQPLELQRVVEDGLHAILVAPTHALQNWVTSNDYDRRLVARWHAEDERVCRITIAVPPRTEDTEFGRQLPNDSVFGGEVGAEYQAAWHRALERLRLEVSNDVFDWLRCLELRQVDPLDYVSVTVVAPTTFIRDWVYTHYRDELFASWRVEDDRVRALAIISPPLRDKYGPLDQLFARNTPPLVREQYEWLDTLAHRSLLLRGLISLPSASGRTGPRSHLPEMEEALRALLNEGRTFPTKKAAYRAVLERLKVPPGTRGWSYKTFVHLKFWN